MLYSTIYWILGKWYPCQIDCTPFDFALSRLRTNSFQIAQSQCQAVWFRPSLVCARVTVGCKGASDSASCSGHLCNCPSLSESEKKGHPSHNLLETNTSLDGMQTEGGRKEVGSWLPDGYSQMFRLHVFVPSGWRTMAPLCCAAKFDPFLSLDCTRVEGSNFAIWQPWVSLLPFCLRVIDDDHLILDNPRPSSEGWGKGRQEGQEQQLEHHPGNISSRDLRQSVSQSSAPMGRIPFPNICTFLRDERRSRAGYVSLICLWLSWVWIFFEGFFAWLMRLFRK